MTAEQTCSQHIRAQQNQYTCQTHNSARTLPGGSHAEAAGLLPPSSFVRADKAEHTQNPISQSQRFSLTEIKSEEHSTNIQTNDFLLKFSLEITEQNRIRRRWTFAALNRNVSLFGSVGSEITAISTKKSRLRCTQRKGATKNLRGEILREFRVGFLSYPPPAW